MPKQLPKPPVLHRDGTSQAGRLQAALNPDYVSVDERSVKDLLTFAQEYAKELRYFNEHNEAQGDWSGFLAGNVDDMVAYLQDPERIQGDPDRKSRYSRPHVALFLTFLELLQHARTQLNELTRRHLDFYYQEALRLTPKEAVPDRVHVLLELADGQDQFHLPAGTLLYAGQDSLGADLFYRTDDQILANQARVASLKSLFVEKKVIGIREVHQRPDILIELAAACSESLKVCKSDDDKKFMGMLAMALGKPGPGGKLEPYNGNRTVNISLLERLDALLSFITLDLYMPHSVFRTLMHLKHKQDEAAGKWDQINNILKKAAKTTIPTFKPDRNFEKNLLAALGLSNFDGFFAGLSEVENIYDLYRRREREDVQNFIRNDLHLSLDNFNTMMGAIDDIHMDWRRIYGILRAAGRKKKWKDPRHRLKPTNIRAYENQNIDTLTRETLGTINYPKIQGMQLESLQDCYGEMMKLKAYFHMSAEDFVFIRKIHEMDSVATDAKDKARPWEWEQVYAILEKAHKLARGLPPRRKELEEKHKSNKGFEAMILFALGDPNPGDELPDKKTFMGLDPVKDKEYIRQKLYLEIPNFRYIKDVAKQLDATDEQWRKELEEKHKSNKGFEAMILFALGDPNPGDELPDKKTFMGLDPVKDKEYIRQKLYLEIPNFRYIKDVAKQLDATDEQWEQVYAILEKAHKLARGLLPRKNMYIMLERAQRRKRGWGEPRAEIEKWENIYAAPDATQVQVRRGQEETLETPRWRTFGEGYRPPEEARTVPAAIGLAIASPLLALAEGNRTITLTLGNKDHFDKGAIDTTLAETIPFRFFLSTAEKMVEVIDEKGTVEEVANVPIASGEFNVAGDDKAYAHALQITLRLGEQAPPVEPLTGDAGIRTPWPVLQILLNDNEEGETVTKRYRAFQPLLLEKVHLKVDVEGIKALTLQNDDGVLDAKKPFEPFGLSPVAGSRFYIAHPELCAKRLDRLDIQMDWLGAPDNLGDYYKGYQDYEDPTKPPASPVDDNKSFMAQLKLYDNRAFFEIDKIQLFHANKEEKTAGAEKTRRITVDLKKIEPGYPNYTLDLRPVTGEEVLDWSRYWQFELLKPDFLHAIYPRAAAGCANKVVADPPVVEGTDPPKPFTVNPPYTPKLKRISMAYSASVRIDLTADRTASEDQLYHIEPFGYHKIARDADGFYPFLPQYEHEGELFIGIKDLAPPRNLCLLFQMAEGSADPDLEREPVKWWYLSGNHWKSLEKGNLLSDTTNGLLNTGIIKFELPPVEPSTMLPVGSFWIRATITKNSRSIADTVAIRAQAMSATFVDRGSAPDHLNQPLPAGSIAGPADPQPEIKAIHQPYSSIGGKGPEQAGRFYTRVSERLRHKNRALTSWDYERIILEAFPGIYKVKCLPVGASENPRLADRITIIVIPDIRGKLPFDPFEPKVPAETLRQIEQYLLRHTAPFARFKVKNPTYVRLRVRFGVRFRPGYNPGYYAQLLNEELQRYLAPWAYDESAEIVFGGKINASLIVNFIDDRPYVDYMAGIKFFTSLDDESFTVVEIEKAELQGVSAGAPDAILVSAREHVIDLISEEVYEEKYFTGINYMKIELDFQVAGE